MFVISIYNRLVQGRNAVEAAWRQIDVQLRRRHDLIPNLVASVKDYMQWRDLHRLPIISIALSACIILSLAKKQLLLSNSGSSSLTRTAPKRIPAIWRLY